MSLWETEKLNIPRPVLKSMVNSAKFHRPNEMCGVLLGWGRVNAEIWWPIRNVHDEPTRHYQMDAIEQVRAWTWAERHDMQVVAIVHSHPTSGSDMSSADLKYASQSGLFYVIMGMKPRGIRAWMVDYDPKRNVFTANSHEVHIDPSKPGLTYCHKHGRYEDSMSAVSVCERCGHVMGLNDLSICAHDPDTLGTISDVPSVS